MEPLSSIAVLAAMGLHAASSTRALPREGMLLGKGYWDSRREGPVIFQLKDTAPAWLIPIADAIADLAALSPGWDSYGAPAIDRDCIQSALQVLETVLFDWPDPALAPCAVPTASGGVQLEWHIRDVDLELEIASPYRHIGFFHDLRTDRAWEAEVSTDLRPLVEAIRIIAQRAENF